MTRSKPITRPLGAVLACGVLALSACVSPPEVQSRAAPTPIATTPEAPPEAAPGTCWGKETTPPETIRVIEPVLIQPAQIASDGTLINPPIYRRTPQERITRPASHRWFETPCAAEMTPDYISSVQRALAVRGLYQGGVTGEMDAKTRRAIRKFQQPQGLDSETLSLAAARTLGLAPALRPETTPETPPKG